MKRVRDVIATVEEEGEAVFEVFESAESKADRRWDEEPGSRILDG
jgi:hypothetical protein